MEALKLAIKKRGVTGKPVKRLRQASQVPGVIYGHGLGNRNVAVAYNEFARAYRTGGESSLFDLELEGDGVVKALIKDVQVDPLSGRYSHVDFYEVNLKEKIKTEIVLNFVGESPAVKELGGSLVKSLDRLKVECLPTALVHQIDVDVSALKSFDDMIHVRDMKIPEGIHVFDNPDEVVATAEAPMTEEQLKAMEAPATVDVTAIKTEAEEKKAAEEAKKVEEAAVKE